MSVLDETHNLLYLYRYALGPMEVPRNYLKWAFMGMLAGLVGNRVWVRKLGKRLAPNLYINFLGASATGKDTAIDKALDLVIGDERLARRFNYYNGTASHQKLFQRMTRKTPEADGVPQSQLCLVTPELSYSLGNGESADGFIKFMTALYGGKDYLIERDTVTGGNYVLKDHCLNWISGSTINWFPFQALEGGFIGRIVMVEGKYMKERHFDPQPPPDADEVIAFIKARLLKLAWLSGEFTKTPEARHTEEVWYNTREWPENPVLMPMFRREHDLMLKLSMIFSMIESSDMVITPAHMNTATEITKHIYEVMPLLAAHTNAVTHESKAQLWVETYIKEKGRVMRSRLMNEFSSQGGNAMQLDQIMRTLEEGKKVTHEMDGRARWYTWNGKKRAPVGVIPKLRLVQPNEEDEEAEPESN